MGTMTRDEWRAFVLSGSRTAKVATASRDGRTLVVPVWFDRDGDDVVFETDGGSAKARNIASNPNVSIWVDDERFPFAFVSIRGRARIERRSPRELLPWTMRLSRRYAGDHRAATRTVTTSRSSRVRTAAAVPSCRGRHPLVLRRENPARWQPAPRALHSLLDREAKKGPLMVPTRSCHRDHANG